MGDDVDAFYEYAKNNFLNLIKSNKDKDKDKDKFKDKDKDKDKGSSKNETENTFSIIPESSAKQKSRIKGWNESDFASVEQLKQKEIEDNETYDEKYKQFLLRGKKESKKKYDNRYGYKYSHSHRHGHGHGHEHGSKHRNGEENDNNKGDGHKHIHEFKGKHKNEHKNFERRSSKKKTKKEKMREKGEKKEIKRKKKKRKTVSDSHSNSHSESNSNSHSDSHSYSNSYSSSYNNSSSNSSSSGSFDYCSSSEEIERGKKKYSEKLQKYNSNKHKRRKKRKTEEESEKTRKSEMKTGNGTRTRTKRNKDKRCSNSSDSEEKRTNSCRSSISSECSSKKEQVYRYRTDIQKCVQKKQSQSSEEDNEYYNKKEKEREKEKEKEKRNDGEGEGEIGKEHLKIVRKNRETVNQGLDNEKLKRKLEWMIEEKKNEMLMRNALNKNLVDCKYCIDSNNFHKINKLNVISISKRSYICYYNYKNIFLKHQLFISPIEHTVSITNTNIETINDIRNHMKSIIGMLEPMNETCIFVEFNNCFNKSIELISMRKTKHTYINCYVIPLELLSKAKSYFKKNLEDVNSLYRENKQLIITNQKYAPYNVIPKNMPYVSINFALVETYIQIIENNYDYINMCKCIFTDLYKKDKLYKYFKNFDHYVMTVEQFKNDYKKFDWTNYQIN